MHRLLLLLLAALALASPASAESLVVPVAGLERQALLFLPETRPPAGVPLVLVFHGHGGTMQHAARKFRIHEVWPDAAVVYPQGLATATPRDPQGRLPGWQVRPGQEGDRDLLFVDALLAEVRKRCPVDPARVYVTGHSNGGAFTYLLWYSRPGLFAAVAPSAAAPQRGVDRLEPLPAMHVAGTQDAIVAFDRQRRTMEAVRRRNGCAERGEKWAEGALLYPSPGGTPFIEVVYEGGHAFPDAAPALIARFFQEHRRRGASAR